MDLNTPLHGYIHLKLIILLVAIGYISVFLNKAMIRSGKRTENRKATNLILVFILMVYGMGYLYLTFFYRTPMEKAHIQVVPFWSYREAFDGFTIRRLSVARSIVLNILLFIPLGYLLPSFMRSFSNRYIVTVLIIFGLSILTEAVQYFTRTGLCEIDDVISNGIGGLLGLAGYAVAGFLITGIQKTGEEKKGKDGSE